MFARLTDLKRWRAASLLVALYALCLVTPTAVLAFSASPAAAHCLTDDHHGMSSSHAHKDGADHQHSGGGDDHGQTGKCCGLFCVTAIPPAHLFVTTHRTPASHLTSLFAESLSGRGSDRIDRPPRSLLSL